MEETIAFALETAHAASEHAKQAAERVSNIAKRDPAASNVANTMTAAAQLAENAYLIARFLSKEAENNPEFAGRAYFAVQAASEAALAILPAVTFCCDCALKTKER